ncbi:MAG: carotenoid oxygenase family protein [Actinomycetota bacterium]|nr:carotenoid oxygenase family protein [Actinomycetota bacterium]
MTIDHGVAGAVQTENTYLEGNFAPVLEEVTAFDLTVDGELPPSLDGRYLRNGPNPIDADPATYHWFTGDGMVHGIRLRDGRAEWYRNRWVRSGSVPAALGEVDPGGPVTEGADFAANTNVIGVAGRCFAIVEAGAKPVELDGELGTIGRSDLDGTLPYGATAHPKVDPATGELHLANYFWGRPDVIEYVVVGPDARVRHRQDIDAPGSPMVHDMSITEHHAVFYDLPVAFDLDSAMTGASFPYAWNPEHASRVGVLPLGGGTGTDAVRWFEVSPCYVFHSLNAHDVLGADGSVEQVVLDVVRHDRVFDRSRLGPDESVPTLWRWTLDLRTGGVSETQLDDVPVEFPRVDERRVGRRQRHGWAVGLSNARRTDSVFEPDCLYHHDFDTGVATRHELGPGRSIGEAVFVPSGPDADEDDGHLLALVHDATDDRSSLVVLAAQDLAAGPVATVHLPQRVPYGFHGNWLPA